MFLTDQERRRFCDWLRQQILSSEAIGTQMTKLPHMETLAKQERAKMSAFAFVLGYIENCEHVPVEPKGEPNV